MKSVRFSLINKKFDDQYTFDLQGYLSVQDFCSTLNLLNQSARDNPPPGNKLIWCVSVWILWMVIIICSYLTWMFTNTTYGLIIMPFLMMLLTILIVWRFRVIRQRFEQGIIKICNRINATENIRGINYRFSKNGSDLTDVTKQLRIVSTSNFKTIYSIVIEFDDRYNALSSEQYNRYPSIDFVTVPLYAHINPSSKDEKYRSWSAGKSHQYDEKFIIQYQ